MIARLLAAAGKIVSDGVGSHKNVVLDLNPLKLSTKKLCALIASNPDVRHFDTSTIYKINVNESEIQIRLTMYFVVVKKPLKVDFDNLQSLSDDDAKKLEAYLQFLKRRSIFSADKRVPQEDVIDKGHAQHFIYVGNDDTVYFLDIDLSHSLVVYESKKCQTDRHIALLEKKIGEGAYGATHLSTRSLLCFPDSVGSRGIIVVNHKRHEKWRVLKVQADYSTYFCRLLLADHENEVTKKLAPELAMDKPLVRSAELKLSALFLRYVPGNNLKAIMDNNLIKTDLERLTICLLAAEALQAVHAKGGIYRDMKPENIMIDMDGRIRLQLIDFGLSIIQQRHDKKGVVGSLQFIAPELLCNGDASAASDVYSLCRVFEEVLGYTPGWIDEPHCKTTSDILRLLHRNATIPYDKQTQDIDKSVRDHLNQLGLATLLSGMRTKHAYNRMSLDLVIERLKSLIKEFQAVHQSRSIFSPVLSAAAAAQPVNDVSLNAIATAGSASPRLN